MPLLLFKIETEADADALTRFAFENCNARWKMEASAEKAFEIEAERDADIRAWVNFLAQEDRK